MTMIKKKPPGGRFPRPRFFLPPRGEDREPGLSDAMRTISAFVHD